MDYLEIIAIAASVSYLTWLAIVLATALCAAFIHVKPELKIGQGRKGAAK